MPPKTSNSPKVDPQNIDGDKIKIQTAELYERGNNKEIDSMLNKLKDKME